MINKLGLFTKRLWKRYSSHNIAATSAQIAYYWILAFFPFLIFILTLLSYTQIPTELFLSNLSKVVPASLVPFIENTVERFISYRSTTLLSVGVLISLWSGGTAVNAMIRGIHLAYNSKYVRPFWLARLSGVVYTIMLALLIIVMMVGMVFGDRVGRYIIRGLDINTGIFMPLWNLGRLIMTPIALLVVLYIIYTFVPRKYTKYKNVWPGTLVAALGWYVFTLFFSVYIDNYSKYNQLYGSIGSIFILLIWLYASCMLLLIGAEVNALYQEIKLGKSARRFIVLKEE
ncbi:hypothetical protein CS063_13615 [Sporanaerobium hydrogeniformans]|uniref:Uncharacterized protein n=1 Tax=Sporanaerobium hydrogeniformans TaxID=3072179 RepID=A0AC61D988_9FIRM|nr:YihY/virulence factor BrkB family protein [Sporanaerobium hydrogeniformans]PHV69871.1 hypothetical protein CS063_13615 [Sporanaerobium hydrogeniformans]